MKSVSILGLAPGWNKCPPDQETWVIGKALLKQELPARIDRIFSMDKTDEMGSFDKKSPHYMGYPLKKFIEKMNGPGVPFVTSYCVPGLEHCEPYPLKEIVERYGVLYFTNTICYMIAYAMFNGYERIDIWGVRQQGKAEYVRERRGVEFWLGLAAGTGVLITVNGPSPLLHDDIVYGYKKTEEQLVEEFGIDS